MTGLKPGVSLVDEFLSEWQEISSEFESTKTRTDIGSSYPDVSTQMGGGTEEEIESELSRMLGCGRTAIRFLGVITGADYYKFISCMKWFCEKCGTHGGKIHKRRVSGVLKRVESLLDTMSLRQFIFTVPEAWRPYFRDRKAINSFIRMVEKLISKRYPGKKCIAYFHAFGDEESKGKYHPHVNVHVIEEEPCVMRIPEVELREMKKALWRGLLGYILSVDNTFQDRTYDDRSMNLRYAFYLEKERILHKLKYMSRLHPNYGDFQWIRKDPELAGLFIVKMKGFSYIRYFNGFNYQKQADVDRAEEVKEAESVAGEPLRYVQGGEISRGEFDLKYRSWDYEELSDGFFRIRKKKK